MDEHDPPAALLDLGHLARQTFGDRALETQVLELFATEIADLVGRLPDAGADRQNELLHSIKGSAAAVGSFALSHAAARLECRPAAARISTHDMDELRALASSTLAEVRRRLA